MNQSPARVRSDFALNYALPELANGDARGFYPLMSYLSCSRATVQFRIIMSEAVEPASGFVRPILPMIGENKAQTNYTFPSNSMMIQGPGGVLDLSLYNYQPSPQRSQVTSSQNAISEVIEEGSIAPSQHQPPSTPNMKKKRFKGPRRSSWLERFIALLEDKRVMEDGEDAHQLEDIKMPRLRNVLNIIFITAGVCFLLAVVIVILYTTFAR
ncbi:hypothetical protein Aperf_G00000012634 [Anoplocephala perfoliata]